MCVRRVSIRRGFLSRTEALEAVRSAAQEAAAAGELPAFLADLERVRVEAVLVAAAPKPAPAGPRTPSRLLSVREAAERLGRSRWWVYRHKATLPVTRLQTGGFGFDEKALELWIEGRTGPHRRGKKEVQQLSPEDEATQSHPVG
jgi:predicted DNA-binding transcriptional regulator AlpA